MLDFSVGDGVMIMVMVRYVQISYTFSLSKLLLLLPSLVDIATILLIFSVF